MTTAAQTKDESGLDVIEPKSIAMIIDGEVIRITPMKVGQIPGFVREAGALFSSLEFEEGDDGEDDVKLSPELIAEHGENIIAAVAIAVRLDKEDIEDLELDEFIELVENVIKINADFFKERVIPAFQASLKGIGGIGLTPSRLSSKQGTDTAT